MTTRIISRPQDIEVREARVRLPLQTSAPLFQGWGPKF
jgi:hypothetical protein